jgi:transcription-repair coupling factor (superfamily II helicase)
MVVEAVGELKGDSVPEPPDLTIDVPIDANLPRDYVARDDVRMEAYRRLAAVTTPADVDDIRDEWEDRYGPPPPAAEALLAVARLRAECARVGVTGITVQRNQARITGLALKESQKVRLRRLAPKAVAKDDEIVVPVAGKPEGVASALVALLAELIPAPDETALTSAAP